MGRCLTALAILLLATAAVPLGAQPVIRAEPVSVDPVQAALLPVKVNEIEKGEVLAIVDGDDIFVTKAFLDQLGLPTGAVTRQYRGDTFVSLHSLAPKVTFGLNPDDLSLSITADPKLLGHEVLELRKGAIADKGGDPAAFFNYAFSGARHEAPSFFGELGASNHNYLLYTGLSRTAGTFTRGLSYANFDWPVNMRRLTVGDAIVGNDPLGGSATIGGLTLSREYSLQPYFIRNPSVDATGTAVTPSTVEVYVNGQLTNRIDVGPGVFTLHDLPATAGLGNTRLVIRDAFGRESVQEGGYYYSTAALRKGLSEYVFSAGLIREDQTKNFDYGDAAALGQYRRGLTDWLTLGGRAETSRSLVNAAPRLTLGTLAGDLDVEVAGSRAGGTTGTAAMLAYRFNTMRYSFGVAGTTRSSSYATLSLPPTAERTTRDISVFTAVSLRRLSLAMVAASSEERSGEHLRRISAQTNVPVGRFGNVFISAGSIEQHGKRTPEVLFGLTLSIGNATTANVAFQRSQGVDNTHVELRKPLGMASGYGYALQKDTSTDSQLATLQYQSSFGRYEIDVDPKDTDRATYSVSGGFVALGKTIVPSRAVDQSFALARVGVPGVDVFASNQKIGRTNRGGDLLIPNLLPHYANELRIDDRDVPLDYEVADTTVSVVPPSKGGVVARFPVKRIRSYTGKLQLMIVGDPYTPSLGELDMRRNGVGRTLPLGRSGEFYFDDLDPGTYQATLRIGQISCGFTLTLPETPDAITDLGVVQCTP